MGKGIILLWWLWWTIMRIWNPCPFWSYGKNLPLILVRIQFQQQHCTGKLPCAIPVNFFANTSSQISFTSIFALMSLQRIDFSSIYEFSQYKKRQEYANLAQQIRERPRLQSARPTHYRSVTITTHDRHKIASKKQKQNENFVLGKSNENFSHDYSFLGSIFSSVIYIYIDYMRLNTTRELFFRGTCRHCHDDHDDDD